LKFILVWPASFAALILIACAHSTPQEAVSADSAQLQKVIEHYTDATKHLDPYDAAYYNVEADLSQFGDYPSKDYFERSKKIYQVAIQDLKKINPKNLTDSEQLTYRLFKEDMSVSLEGFDFPNEYLALNQMQSRLHDYIDSSSEALTSFPFDSVAHYEAYLKRSEGFSAYVDRQIALLREGLKKKIVLSCTVVAKVPNTYKDALEVNIEANPFYRPATFMPKGFTAAEQLRLKNSFKEVVSTRILPGYQKFDQFFRNEYAPHCRKGFGLTGLPNAKKWYRYQILSSTNLDIAPEELHQKGLKEVERISSELEKIKEARGFKGSLPKFLKSIVQDPKFFFTNASDMFGAFQKVKEQTALKIPQYFSLVPQSDFKIVETSNPEDAAGSYNQPTELLPYGRFVVNTKNLRSVPTYEVTTLLMHETVPGHHFQLALQYEMKDQLSEYQRKMFNSNSFVEGWALYSEYLGNEMGMYSDPMQRFGNLNDDMLRAVRLVVDTGIHSMGWSQSKAIAYMQAHLASDIGDITNEANRYSVWPGQALGYKVGQLKILELRHKAEKELGDRFDIKGFHQAVIGHGTVSLGVLETQVEQWMTKVKTP
jgi:uncharacterized protein (DUF885 family)